MHIDKTFEKIKIRRISNYKRDFKFLKAFQQLNNLCVQKKYTYNFSWLGIPVIQYPSDLISIQELIYLKKPDLIIETGIARAGSLIFYSTILNYYNKKSKVLGIDIDIRRHAKNAIRNHSIKNIITIEGSSLDANVKKKIEKITKDYKKIIVILDSIHTHEHVLNELNFYSKFVKKNLYIVVCDTTPNYVDTKTLSFIKKNYKFNLSKKFNARSAINKFLLFNKNFKIDKYFNHHSLLTNCKDGFLKRIK